MAGITAGLQLNSARLEECSQHEQTRTSQFWSPEGKRNREKKRLKSMVTICVQSDQWWSYFEGNLGETRQTQQLFLLWLQHITAVNFFSFFSFVLGAGGGGGGGVEVRQLSLHGFSCNKFLRGLGCLLDFSTIDLGLVVGSNPWTTAHYLPVMSVSVVPSSNVCACATFHGNILVTWPATTSSHVTGQSFKQNFL